MPQPPMLVLKDGTRMPQLGLGFYRTPDAEAAALVGTAIAAGYRLFDTAANYANEAGVGAGIKASGIDRDEVFVTTKLWNEQHGFDSALRAFDASLEALGLDRLDLYLIHWPSPTRGLYVDSWKALVRIQQEGRARSVGVCNFSADYLRQIMDATGVAPSLNQIEVHPHFQQKALRAFNAEHGIRTESWAPLGKGKDLADPVLGEIAAKHGKSVAQVIIRWHLDSGLIAIPKSVRAERVRENIDVFDFALNDEDRTRIDGLDRPDGRVGPNPVTATF